MATQEKTVTAQKLQSEKTVNRILQPFSALISWRGLIRQRLQDVAEKFGEETPAKIAAWLRGAGEKAIHALATTLNVDESILPKILEMTAAAVEQGRLLKVNKVTASVADGIMAAVDKATGGWRTFFTKKGTAGLAKNFWQLMAGPQTPEGHVATFEKIVSGELGRLLKQAMKKAGFETEPKPTPTTAEKIAQFLGDDPLRSDKLKLVDEAVRSEIEAIEDDARREFLTDLWDETLGTMRKDPSSEVMAKRIVQETIKGFRLDWNKLFASGATSVAALRTRLIKAIETKVHQAATPRAPGETKLDLSEFNDLVGRVFDEISATRQNRYEMGRVYANARKALNLTDAPEKIANQLIAQYAKTQSDTPNWSKSLENQIRKIFREYLKWNETPESFRKKMADAGVGQSTTDKLLSVANREQAITRLRDHFKEQEALAKWLANNRAIAGLMQKAGRSLGINWQELFTGLPETQAERKAALFDRISKHSRLQSLTEATRRQLADALESAWEGQRNTIFRREFAKMVELPNVKSADKAKLENALPELLRQANLGLLDNEAFRNALAVKYGIETLDGPTGVKLLELSIEAQKAPEGLIRNRVYQKMVETLWNDGNINPYDLLRDSWFANVMSRPTTNTNIGIGSAISGLWQSTAAAFDAAVVKGRPDLGLRIFTEFLKGIPEAVQLGTRVLATGEVTHLPHANERYAGILNGTLKPDSLEMYKKSGVLWKKLYGQLAYVRRLNIALDFLGSVGVRRMGIIYGALTRNDQAQIENALKRFNASESSKAEKQAREDLGPNANPLDMRIRTREILDEEVSRDIRDDAKYLAEVAALNNNPEGWGGIIYSRIIADIPFVARAPFGLAFARAGINLVQNLSNWYPGTGAINWARATWTASESFKNLPKDSPFRAFGLDVIPERRRLIAAAQIGGLGISAAVAAYFLSGDDDDDKEPKRRQVELNGGWYGLTQEQKKQLMAQGERPNSIRVGNRSYPFAQLIFAAPLAMIGAMRDQQRFNPEHYNEQSVMQKLVNGWFAGLGAVEDMTVLSQFTGMFNRGSQRLNDDEISKFNKFLANSVGRSAEGLVPFSGALQQIETWFNPYIYKPEKSSPGFKYWIRNLPVVRSSAGLPMLNTLGDPVEVRRLPWRNFISEKSPDDPILDALADRVEQGLFLTQDSKIVVDSGGNRRSMTDTEFYQFFRDNRKLVKQELQDNLELFKAMSAEDAKDFLRQTQKDARAAIRSEMNFDPVEE